MPERKTLRVFISSPFDVRPERLMAERIVAKLDRELGSHCRIEAVLWERRPLVATKHFQHPDNIPAPRTTDIVVVVLWGRLGKLLPFPEFRGAMSGRAVTGTEWEFEDAYEASTTSDNGLPDLLIYRKTAPLQVDLGNDETEEIHQQKRMLDDFVRTWLMNADGTFRAASSTFASPAELEEMLELHLRARILQTLGNVPDIHRARWQKGSPFRGLESFELEHAQVFFGRTRAKNELREALAERADEGVPFLLVIGSSGSGKSSLVKAGLLPDLLLPGMLPDAGLVRWAALRPSEGGASPLKALASALRASTALPDLAIAQDELETMAADELAGVVAAALAELATKAKLAEPWKPRLVLLVDQLEELFSDAVPQAERVRFVADLEALVRRGNAVVVATMRSDFFDRLETIPKLVEMSRGPHLFRLLSPDDAEIGQIIVQPAQEAGLKFQPHPRTGIPLNETLRVAAAAEPGILPLLEFTLEQLWRRRTDEGELTYDAYEKLGELKGAIGRRAEEIFAAQPASVQAALPRLLFAFARAERGEGKVLSRRASLGTFAEGSDELVLAKALLAPDARLIVTDEDGSLRVAHEAMLTHWKRAADILDQDRADLELRARLEAAAVHWREASEKNKESLLLQPGLPLAEAVSLVRRRSAELPADVVAFVDTSRLSLRRRRVRLALSLAGAMVALPLIAGLVWAFVVWRGVRAVEGELAFVDVPAGCFVMGSPDGEEGRTASEGPAHDACVAAIQLGKFEVTQGEWRQVMVLDPEPSKFSGDDRLPVEMVSWNDAKRFVALMSIFGKRQYRLPSEAEWEYAARAGTPASHFWGPVAEDGCAYANMNDLTSKATFPDEVVVSCDDHVLYTAPVGSFAPNGFGLHDMIGNVGEWVEDCYVPSYEGAPKDGAARLTGDCKARVNRGGSWYSYPRNLRAASRGFSPAIYRDKIVGLRIVRF